MGKKRTVAKQTTPPRDERERQRSRRHLRHEKVTVDRQMKPEMYGSAIDQIWIDFYFCTNQRGCTQNIVVIDDDARLSLVELHKRLLKMYPAAQIRRENLLLRKRLGYGGLAVA